MYNLYINIAVLLLLSSNTYVLSVCVAHVRHMFATLSLEVLRNLIRRDSAQFQMFNLWSFPFSRQFRSKDSFRDLYILSHLRREVEVF